MTITETQRKRIKQQLKKRRITRDFKIPAFPTMIELEYGNAIVKEVKKIDDLVKEILIPELNRLTGHKEERFDKDEENNKIFKGLFGIALANAIIQRIKGRFYGEFLTEDAEPTQNLFTKSTKRLVKPFLERTEKRTKEKFVAEFERQTGTKPLDSQINVDEFVQDALRTNVSLIKSIPQEHFSKLRTEIENAVRKGELSTNLQKKIREISNVSKKRARLIARDQIGKLVGNLEEARQRKIGVKEYIWRTVRDSRVRSFSNTKGYSDHARLEGTIQKWSDPPITVFRGKRAGERHHPGTDIQCRCHPQPVYDEITGVVHPDTVEAREKTARLKEKEFIKQEKQPIRPENLSYKAKTEPIFKPPQKYPEKGIKVKKKEIPDIEIKKLKSLSDDEKSYISWYSGDGFKELNDYLRNPENYTQDRVKIESLNKFSNSLNSAINKRKSDDDMVIFRGVNSDKFTNFLKSDDLIGKELKINSFQSATKSKHIVGQYSGIAGVEMRINVKKGTNLIDLASENISRNMSETEVLLPNRGKYVIKNIRKSDDKLALKTILEVDYVQ